jgi:hypothetical protein
MAGMWCALPINRGTLLIGGAANIHEHALERTLRRATLAILACYKHPQGTVAYEVNAAASGIPHQ